MLLLTAVFTSGGAVMVVEILGSRLLGPFFGVGLFVWSSLLAVTLTALAAGYYVGGRLADRKPEFRQLFVLLIGAGCLVALMPPCAEYVLQLMEPLGIRWGALGSATILIGPSLVVMGMVTTTAVRFAALDTPTAGRSVGLVYAVSTLGGLCGTLLAGFVLVPRWAVNNTLAATAAALIAVGVTGLLLAGRTRSSALFALTFPLVAVATTESPKFGDIHILERSETLLGRLAVVEDNSRGTPLRLLRADHSFIGGLWVESKEPAFGFVHLLEAVHLARPQGTRLLQIGLGIGSLPMALARHSIRSDVVEIDPEVIRLAQKYFGYSSTGALYAEDARTTIRRLRGRYDFIVHDAFTGGSVPEHLLSLEVLEQLERLLEPGGVLALNFVGTESGPLAASAHAVNRTLRAAFGHVRVFRDGPRESASSSLSNLVFFASNQPIRFQPASSFESETCRNVLTHFQEWEVLKTVDPSAEIITDARNPLARLTLPVSEAFWEDMNSLYPSEFWVH